MSGKSPIRTAVLGLGRAGYGIHVRLLRDRDDYEIVAVADPSVERRKEVADEFGSATFADLDAMLSGSDAELVIIATASKDHADHTVKALEAGRHVVVEKPMATTLADADRVIAARDKSGKRLTVHQSQRWNRTLAFVKNMLGDERLGGVFYIKTGRYSFAQRNDWQTLRKYGGGSLNNNGVHVLDQCYQLVDAPVTSVWGDLKQVLAAGDAEDHCQVVMRTETGLVIEMDLTSACAIPLPQWVIMGKRGTMVIDDGKAKLRYAKSIPELPEPEDAAIVKARAYGVQGDVAPIEFVEDELDADADPPAAYYDGLYAALREGAELAVTPESCREVLEIITRSREGTPFPAQ